MSETMTELSLRLDERHTADFEMIGNGGFAPLTGFQGSADWERVCAEMRTAAGDLGLALVRLEALGKGPLTAEGATLTPRKPDWVKFQE